MADRRDRQQIGVWAFIIAGFIVLAAAILFLLDGPDGTDIARDIDVPRPAPGPLPDTPDMQPPAGNPPRT